MNRVVEPELLDALAPNDPKALRSRQDLQRLNAWMRNHGIVANALRAAWPVVETWSINDLGGGDGMFLLKMLRRTAGLTGVKGSGQARIVDRHDVVSTDVRRGLSGLGWQLEVLPMDVFAFFGNAATGVDTVLANLFLHHLTEPQLRALFEGIAARARLVVALEPRRSRLVHFLSRCVGLIGSGPITRHDAPVSVRAGFCDHELSGLWRERGGWVLSERRAGLFGHLFVAQKIDS